MKLIRFGEQGSEKTGLLVDNKRIDVSSFIEDYNQDFFTNGGVEKLREWYESKNNHTIVPNTIRLGAPVATPSKIICIGKNYTAHAKEMGGVPPQEPVLFFKATTAIVGPYDNVVIPKNSVKTDWEVELAVMIGKRASYINQEEAMDYVGGYLLHNDVSEREFQLEKEGQWMKGKSCDTFAPLGPFLATPDEIKDPHNLDLWLTINGEKLQDSNTKDFIFNIPAVVSYISQFMTLLPGDIISTGTPAGVGMGLNPPRYLKKGDVIELGIEGLGSSRQEVTAYEVE